MRYREVSEYIIKSTGRMLVLMLGQDLPLIRFTHGQRIVYTTVPFGPHPDSVYDWARSSPVKFTERQVEKAIESGLVARDGNKIWLSNAGHSLARPCTDVWGPIIDEHFRSQGYTTDWRKMRD